MCRKSRSSINQYHFQPLLTITRFLSIQQLCKDDRAKWNWMLCVWESEMFSFVSLLSLLCRWYSIVSLSSILSPQMQSQRGSQHASLTYQTGCILITSSLILTQLSSFSSLTESLNVLVEGHIAVASRCAKTLDVTVELQSAKLQSIRTSRNSFEWWLKQFSSFQTSSLHGQCALYTFLCLCSLWWTSLVH